MSDYIRSFYFAIISSVSVKEDYRVLYLKTNHTSVKREVQSMIDFMEIFKELKSSSEKEYYKKLNNILTPQLLEHHKVKYVFNTEQVILDLEQSSLCVVFPEQEKYFFCNVENEMSMFKNHLDNIKTYGVESWLCHHYPIDNFVNLLQDFGPASSVLASECLHLSKLSSSLTKMLREETEVALEIIGLY